MFDIGYGSHLTKYIRHTTILCANINDYYSLALLVVSSDVGKRLGLTPVLHDSSESVRGAIVRVLSIVEESYGYPVLCEEFLGCFRKLLSAQVRSDRNLGAVFLNREMWSVLGPLLIHWYGFMIHMECTYELR